MKPNSSARIFAGRSCSGHSAAGFPGSFGRLAFFAGAASALICAGCAAPEDPGPSTLTLAGSVKAPGRLEVRRALRHDIPDLKARAAEFGLVDIADVDPTILVDLRYATPHNPTGRTLYPPNMPCFVHAGTARKLVEAQAYLRARGYGLKIWDAYRPPEVHLELWKATGSSGFVSDPSRQWSHHCSGSAVDVTLVDLNGYEQAMPTGFDDFSPKAYYIYQGADPEVAHRLEILQAAMAKARIFLLDKEWWHFVDPAADAREPVFATQIGLELK